MRMPVAMYILVVLSSRLGDPSFGFDDLGHNYNYPNTNGPLNMESLEQNSGEDERPFMLLIPAKSVEEIEKIEENNMEMSDDLPSLIRKVRCKYFRRPRKFRRTTVADNPYVHIPTVRSVPIIIGNFYKHQPSPKASVDNAKILQSSLRSTQIKVRQDGIREKILLRPRPQDSVTLVGEESKKSNDEIPKKYVYHCAEEVHKKLLKKPSMKQRRPDIPIKRGYIKDGIPGGPLKIDTSKEIPDSYQRHESSSPGISMKKSQNSKQSAQQAYSQRLQRALRKKTHPSSIRPCVSDAKTINEPMRIGIPLFEDPDVHGNWYQTAGQWSSANTWQEYPDKKEANDEAYQPLGIEPNALYTAGLSSSYVTPEYTQYPTYTEIEYPPYSEIPVIGDSSQDNQNIILDENVAQPLMIHGQSVSDEDAPAGRERNFVDSTWKNCQHHPISVYEFITLNPSIQACGNDPDRYTSTSTNYDSVGSELDVSLNSDLSTTNYDDATEGATSSTVLLGKAAQPKEVIDDDIFSKIVRENTNREMKDPTMKLSESRKEKPIPGLQSFSGQIDRPVMENKKTSEDKDGDRSVENAFLKAVVEKVVDDFHTVESNSPDGDSERPRFGEDLAVMQRLFSLPEVQELVLDDAKRIVSDMGDLSEFGFSMARVADSALENIVVSVISSLSFALKPELLPTSRLAEDFQLYRKDASSNQGLKEYIEGLLHNSGVGPEEAKSPIAQNIIFRTVEHSLRNSEIDVDNSVIWDTLKDIVSRPRFTPTYAAGELSARIQMFEAVTTNTPDTDMKKLPIIPVREHVFQHGHWMEKDTVVGKKKPSPEKKGSKVATLQNDEQTVASTSKTWTIGASALGSTNTDTGRLPFAGPEKGIINEVVNDGPSTERVVGICRDCANPKSSGLRNENEAKPEEDANDPIKYYSPIGRILAYRKKIQTPEVTVQKKCTVASQPAKTHTTEFPWSPVGLIPAELPTTTENSFESHRAAASTFPAAADASSTDKFSGEVISSNTFDNSESVSENNLGIVNLGNIDQDISTLDNRGDIKEETPLEVKETHQSKPNEKTVTMTKDLTYLNSAMGTTTKRTMEVARPNDQRHQETLKKPVGTPQDNIINIGTPIPLLIDQSTSATLNYNPTFFGRITVNSVNPATSDNMSGLSDAELFYIGDGVKIPLKVARMPDNSWALSISEKVCENFITRKCPCCVPNEGDIVEKRRRSKDGSTDESNEESSTPGSRFASVEQAENSNSIIDAKGRHTRAFLGSENFAASTTPVVQFAKKYNLTLDLADFTDSSGSWANDVTLSDDVKHTESKERTGSSDVAPIGRDFIERGALTLNTNDPESITSLPQTRIAPQAKRSKILVNAMNRLINSVSAQSLGPMLDYYHIDEQDQEYSRQDHSQLNGDYDDDINAMADETAKYDYQRDNPILEWIRLTSKKHMEQRPYRYQQNIDREARERVDAMTTVLHWLKEVFLESSFGNDNT